MSKVILNDHLWTDEEVAYQLARARADEVAANKALYGPGGEMEGQDHSVPDDDDDGLELDKDIYEHVLSLDIEGLKKELKDNDIQPKGSEQELRVKLASHLQAKRDEESK